MEEKHKDLKSVRQKALLMKIMSELSETKPSFYYLSTVEVATQIKAHIDQGNGLSRDDLALLNGLSLRDIQIILSLH